jgi:hypothetical protein
MIIGFTLHLVSMMQFLGHRYGNCNTLSRRDAFVASLMKHFPVDAPGKCMRNMDEAEALAGSWASHVDVRHYDRARMLAGRCDPSKPS